MLRRSERPCVARQFHNEPVPDAIVMPELLRVRWQKLRGRPERYRVLVWKHQSGDCQSALPAQDWRVHVAVRWRRDDCVRRNLAKQRLPDRHQLTDVPDTHLEEVTKPSWSSCTSCLGEKQAIT